MIRTKIVCPDCGQEISKSNFSKHQRRHQTHPETFHPQVASIENFNCSFCDRICKNANSLRNHERLCKENPNRQIITLPPRDGFNNKGRVAWNKGLTKESDYRVCKNSESLKVYYTTHEGTFAGKHHSSESKLKISLANSGNTKGNRSKKGFYKGIYCGSSYELVYVIYNLEHNIPFKRCESYYPYEYKGQLSNYFPDFELSDGTIIEIKGYHTELVDVKASAVKDKPIKVLYRKDLSKEFEYVCNTYNIKEKEVYKLFDTTETLV